jgi:hypothetical protein
MPRFRSRNTITPYHLICLGRPSDCRRGARAMPEKKVRGRNDGGEFRTDKPAGGCRGRTWLRHRADRRSEDKTRRARDEKAAFEQLQRAGAA